MAGPSVSVIIPVYNTAMYLDECIQSVVNQTIHELEIILVDDGSTDESPEICDRWADADCRIQVVHKENEGLGYTRNAGLLVATGRFISFLDSDDTLAKNTYEICIGEMEKYNADASYFGRKTMDQYGIYHTNANIPEKLLYHGDEIRREYVKTYFGRIPDEEQFPYIQASSCCALYSRALIKENQIKFCSEREYLSEDTFFNLDVLNYAEKIIIIAQDFYNYRYNAGSLTKKYSETKFIRCFALIDLLDKYTKKFPDLDDANLRIAYKFLSYTRMSVIDAVRCSTTPYKHVKEMGSNKQLRKKYKNIPQNQVDFMTRLYLKLILSKQYWLLILLYKMKYR